ncbi:MAG: 2-C-methyl-D-erythritol 4-phosphate cytidylyltransferase [Gammaproteobacteria bacterium]|nr:2-C-methyl-D-erythritol 4-phosphate cytidylyltransferase [Gammaproteobacteria bacterium]
MAIWAVVPAAGKGERFGAGLPKQYLPLCGRSLISYCIELFLAAERIDGIVVALAGDDEDWEQLEPQAPAKPLLTATGGSSRAASVSAALGVIADRVDEKDWVLVHDAARPCLARSDLEQLIDTLEDDEVGGILAAPVADTLKRADGASRVAATVDRNGLWAAQTPQMFRFGLLRKALDEALSAGTPVTDEAMAMERAGYRPRLVAARSANPKVTRPDDLVVAEAVLAANGVVESKR